MEIKELTTSDFQIIQNIYGKARQFMKENGNPNQWQDVFPTVEMTETDLQNHNLYGLVNNGKIECVFAYIFGHDPTYDVIEKGSWLNDEPYGVVHRIASDFTLPHAGRICIDWVFEQCHNLRIDTHSDNIPMQRLLKSAGFTYCGIIYTHDGTERLAFQKTDLE